MVRRGYQPAQTLFFYTTKRNYEIDFVCKPALGIESLIQVCYNMEDDAIFERECRALALASKELRTGRCEIITFDREDAIEYKGVGIQCIPAWKWLTRHVGR